MSNKVGLCIGLDYPGTNIELSGCERDAGNWRQWLVESAQYDDVKLVLNPTRKQMVQALRALAATSKQCSEVFISYSGHGSWQRDRDHDEADRRDEGLVPLDYRQAGLLIDDDFHDIVATINPSTHVYVVVDACHSGSMLDLKYRWNQFERVVLDNRHNVKPLVVCLSGCTDVQTSAEAVIDGKMQGALTSCLLKTLREHPYSTTWFNIVRNVRKQLKQGKYSQVPQLTCSRRLTSHHIWKYAPPRRSGRVGRKRKR